MDQFLEEEGAASAAATSLNKKKSVIYVIIEKKDVYISNKKINQILHNETNPHALLCETACVHNCPPKSKKKKTGV